MSPDDPDRYRRLRLLGEGAAGKVWLVEDRLRPGPPLALKELAEESRGREGHLKREFATLAALRHPNLVEVFDLELSPSTGLPRFTLEHIQGDDIVHTSRRSEPSLLLDLAVESLRALAFLHDFGVVHRDLKPGNLLVREKARLGCRLVVLDFGLSQHREQEAAATSGAVGTLPYMAPELFEGAEASRRSDLYALAAVFFEAVHGRTPYVVKAGDIGGFLRSLREGRRARPPVPEGHPQGLARWLEEMLSLDPTLRPVDASEALARLDAACGTSHDIETAATRAARLASGRPAGRDAEIDVLWGHLAPSSDPRLVWLCGPAGIGKTRFLRWLASDAVVRGFEVVAPPPGAEEPSLSALRAQSLRSPTLLLLDEVESAGGSLAELLDRIAREGKEAPLRVVAALRPSEVRDAKVRKLLADTGIVPTLRRVDLAPLETAGIRALAERATGATAVSEARVSWLQEASEGDPLVAESLLVEGVWEKGPRARRAAASKSSVSARADLLSPVGQAWLEALSVLGRSASEEVLASLAGIDGAATREVAMEVEAAGLARRNEGRWSPSSRALAEHVREGMPLERRRSLYRKAAETVSKLDGESADPWHLAVLWDGAGEVERAFDSAIRSAEQAEQQQDRGRAAERLRFALCHLSRRDPRRRDLRARHAEALLAAGAADAAARAFAGALLGMPDGASRTRLMLRHAFALALAMKPKRARLIAEQALELARRGSLHKEEAEAKRILGLSLLRLGADWDALRWLEESVGTLRDVDDPREAATAVHELGLCRSNLRMREAENSFRDAIRLWRLVGDTSEELRSSVGLGRDLARRGRLEEARSVLDDVAEKARRTNNRWTLPSALSLLASIAVQQSRLDNALRLSEEASDEALYLGNVGAGLSSQNNHCLALLACGRPSESASLARKILEHFADRAEPETLDYSRMILARALMETNGPNDAEVRDLLDVAVKNGRQRRTFRQLLVALVFEMERRGHLDCSEEITPVRSEYDAILERAGLEEDAEIVVRAEIATAASVLRRGEAEKARVAAAAAMERAEPADLPTYGALASVPLSTALASLGRTEEADRVLNRGRELLELAAGRISDPSVRRDFLDRPDFRKLREAPQAASEARRLLALYDIIRALNSQTDPEAVLTSILDAALDVVHAERGLILLRDSDADPFVVRMARNLDKESLDDFEAFSRGIVTQAGEGKSVLALDAGHDARFDGFKSVGLYGIRSLLCVPLRTRGKITGTVYLDNRREGRLFTEADLKFLEAFADHAALALENARARAQLVEENLRLQVIAERRVQFANIVGRSPAMQKVFDILAKVAASELPVLILGESGTGKELVARAVHFNGPRKRKVFLTENCAAIPETLLESELFGHVRGAFTGAEKDHHGLFEQADGGTLFLDEVGDTSPSMQARLLRVLQEGEIRRVGGDRAIKVDVRVVAATLRDLQADVAAGRFREDLFYRLQVLVIPLPPLRERPGDIRLLVHHLLEGISRGRRESPPAIARDVMDLLEKHPWPGNVRELENALHRLALHASGGPITMATVEADEMLRRTLLGSSGTSAPLFSLERIEKDQIQRALDASEGNRDRAARLLGISRATIYRKIREYKLT